jgi:hypothetical protein
VSWTHLRCSGEYNGRDAGVEAVPFELCCNGAIPLLNRPALSASACMSRTDLELGGATGNWRVFNDNDLLHREGAMWVGILGDGPVGVLVDGVPAVVLVDGKTLETNLLVLDLEKLVLLSSACFTWQALTARIWVASEVVTECAAIKQRVKCQYVWTDVLKVMFAPQKKRVMLLEPSAATPKEGRGLNAIWVVGHAIWVARLRFLLITNALCAHYQLCLCVYILQ